MMGFYSLCEARLSVFIPFSTKAWTSNFRCNFASNCRHNLTSNLSFTRNLTRNDFMQNSGEIRVKLTWNFHCGSNCACNYRQNYGENCPFRLSYFSSLVQVTPNYTISHLCACLCDLYQKNWTRKYKGELQHVNDYTLNLLSQHIIFPYGGLRNRQVVSHHCQVASF